MLTNTSLQCLPPNPGLNLHSQDSTFHSYTHAISRVLHKRNQTVYLHHETGHVCLCLSLLKINSNFYLLWSKGRGTIQPPWQFSYLAWGGVAASPWLTSTVNACVGSGLPLNNWTPSPHPPMAFHLWSPTLLPMNPFIMLRWEVTARIRKENTSCFCPPGRTCAD